MRIYTSYFAKIKEFPDNMIPIAICGKVPKGFSGPQYTNLAPNMGFFLEWKLTHDNDCYIKCYKEQITDKLDVNKVVSDLRKLANIKGNTLDSNKDICLVCYEKPEDFCHRHLVAKWLNDNGIECEEFS